MKMELTRFDLKNQALLERIAQALESIAKSLKKLSAEKDEKENENTTHA